jgi:DNA-binding transcriptional MerR regulator
MSVQPARGFLGISEVLAQLRPDFADISVSKIRFLETEGLISPARSPSGYRRFCAADVDRLRYILSAQRDQYLPLRVIRDRLDRLDGDATGTEGSPAAGGQQTEAPVADRGRAGRGYPHPAGVPGRTAAAAESGWPADRHLPAANRPADSRPGQAQPPAGRPGQDQEPGQLTRRDLLELAGMSEALLTELDTFGLLRRTGRHYGREALEVARTAVALTAYGVEARHLRAVRAAAEREVTMIESLVAPILRQRAKGAAELAGRTAGELSDLVLRLHCALIDGALAEAGLDGPSAATAGPAVQERPVTRGIEGASA